MSMQTYQDFVARAKDCKPTNHFAATRKLRVRAGVCIFVCMYVYARAYLRVCVLA